MAVQVQSGPGLLVRAIWFLFIGWWLSGLMSVIGWLAMISIIGLPLGIYLINHIPTYITLRPRTSYVTAEVVDGQTRLTTSKRPQVAWPLRFVWFLLVGWWLSAIVMGIAWFLCVIVVTLPIGLLLYNRVPAAASLFRY